MTAISELVSEYDVVRKSFQEKAKVLLKTAFTDFFEKNPTVEAIRWRQYTPYFNDGDACTFGVHEFSFKTADMNEDHGDYSDGFEDQWFWSDGGKRVDPWENERKAVSDFNGEVGKIPDEVFEETFGDHCIVTATRDGFEVDEYDHD